MPRLSPLGLQQFIHVNRRWIPIGSALLSRCLETIDELPMQYRFVHKLAVWGMKNQRPSDDEEYFYESWQSSPYGLADWVHTLLIVWEKAEDRQVDLTWRESIDYINCCMASGQSNLGSSQSLQELVFEFLDVYGFDQ